MAAKKPLIETTNLQRYFEAGDVVTKALDGVSITIETGEFVALMGPSGSGKSTLMHLLGFLDHPTGGKYKFNGKDVSDLDELTLAKMRSSNVGFVFQAFNLLSNASVIDNVMMPMAYAGIPHSKRRKKAIAALEAVNLEHRIDYLSNVISGGEKQRVAIARALVNEPAVLFADEPTGNLDTKSGLEVLQLLAELNKSGTSIIMVTHELDAAHFSERIITLRDGHLISDKPVSKRNYKSYRK